MPPFGPDEASNALNAVQQTFYMAVHDHNFKMGAFKDKVTKSASAVEAADIFFGLRSLDRGGERAAPKDAHRSYLHDCSWSAFDQR